VRKVGGGVKGNLQNIKGNFRILGNWNCLFDIAIYLDIDTPRQ
jgi:hypothetical protein